MAAQLATPTQEPITHVRLSIQIDLSQTEIDQLNALAQGVGQSFEEYINNTAGSVALADVNQRLNGGN